MGYTYDNINNLTALVEKIGDVDRITSYDYDEDNRVTSISTDDSTRSYTYDAYGRVEKLVTGDGTSQVTVQEYTYKSNADGTLTNQISAVTVKDGNGSQLYAYTYTYDQKGNITGISDGTYTTSYAYDSANQLIREDDQQADTTTVWTYDSAGNILTRTVHPYTTGTVGTGTQTNYVYNDSQWGDLLKAYDRRPIIRDEIGNPTKDFIWTYTWQHGRQLASMAKIDQSESWQFTYNADGMRTQRTNGTTTYQYTYLGDQLTHMTVAGHTMYFAYDAAGVPMALTYDGATYYYITNLQGDVIAILDSTGTEVVRYAYDAWGNLIPATGTLADSIGFYNPLRYRGYVYDEETELYYLQTRYYNPEMGRFINADALVTTGQGVLGNNMFAYCGNNPVVRVDSGGDYWETVLDVVSLVISIVDVANHPDDPIAWLGLAADIASLALPFIACGGVIVKAATKADDVVAAVKAADYIEDTIDAARTAEHIEDTIDAVKTGWRVGDDITNLTNAGNAPSWSTVRQRYWKNEAHANPHSYSFNDLYRMKKGLAPIGDDGFSMELHHPLGRKDGYFYIIQPLTRTEHRWLHYGDN